MRNSTYGIIAVSLSTRFEVPLRGSFEASRLTTTSSFVDKRYLGFEMRIEYFEEKHG